MKQKIIKLLTTDSANWGALLMRVPLGLAFTAHGWGKLFKQGGIEGFAKWLSSLGAEPAYFLSLLAGLSEAIGGMLIVIGLLVRFTAFTHVILMITAISLAHLGQPLFGQGSFELQILMLAASFMLLIQGGGKWSLDNLIAKRLNQ
jgi:putative oxidoreductase